MSDSKDRETELAGPFDTETVKKSSENHRREERTDWGKSLPLQVTVIGPSIKMKGELTGSGDLVIEGRIEGQIYLKEHHLTVGPSGWVGADVTARRITVRGQIHGNVKGLERVEISAGGKVLGDIATPKILVEEGALFSGGIQMGEVLAAPKRGTATKKVELLPEPAPAPQMKA